LCSACTDSSSDSASHPHSARRHPAVVRCKTPRKENSPISDFFRAPAFLFPRVIPRLTRRWIKTGAPDKNKSGLLKLLAGFTRKKASTRRVNRKDRRFHAKSTSFLFKVSCSQLRCAARLACSQEEEAAPSHTLTRRLSLSLAGQPPELALICNA